MEFAEKLPCGCPPPEACCEAIAEAYRLVPDRNCSVEHFASHAALGKGRPHGVTDCQFASCSLFPSISVVKKKRKLKSLQKYRFVARLSIPSDAGRAIIQEGHIDFWRFSHFDVLAHVEEVLDATII